MASPPKHCAKVKAAIWKANKEKIIHLVSLGLSISQVEEEMQRSGCRITAQVRECILWEKHAPEVRELLAQGLEVATIEEKMRLNEWIWTDNIRKKALWEYYREEIIELYRSLRSVEAVRDIMARKGFMPKTRIYYEWLNRWGISTSINRNQSEIDALSPYGSNNSTTPGSANIPHQHLIGTIPEPLSSDMRPTGVVDSPEQYHQTRGNALGNQGSGFSISPMLGPEGFISDDDDNSDEDEDAITPLLPIDNAITQPWFDGRATTASEGRRGNIEGPRRMVNPGNTSLMPDQIALDRTHRGSSDSGIGLYFYPPHPPSSIRSSLNPESHGGEGTFQKSVLHSISCPLNHQGVDFNSHCCGSSCLQELAISALTMLPHEVYELLEGVRLYDHAGNTFLHKLAITGAPWAYFKAGINAEINAKINPCHRNAYGQTFAHVLDISAFHDNLTECFVSLLELGIDFGLRDASGRTVLHCLYGQPMALETARQILELIDAPGRLLSLRDVSGQTPYDLLKHNLLQQVSANDTWSTMELKRQLAVDFEHLVNGGVLRLTDKGVDRSRITDNLEEMRAMLQHQYKAVIDNAINGIVVEAVDGSNAFHAQAALTTIHDGPTDLRSLEKFIAVGIDANYYDKYGRTPLEAIITLPRDYETELTTSEKVSLLIDKGKASVNSRNRLGHTPLYSAAIRGLDRTVEVLIQRGSHVNTRDNDSKSLLEAVFEASRQAFGEYLVSPYCRYHEAQVSRIEECKVLLERHGAVLDPTSAQAMGYAPKPPALQ